MRLVYQLYCSNGVSDLKISFLLFVVPVGWQATAYSEEIASHLGFSSPGRIFVVLDVTQPKFIFCYSSDNYCLCSDTFYTERW